ncbi:MAG: tetratricopeptide repeat protein [Myxococcales bacterium]|nr:tetratricopeptide repeat protein [Myxococcales bacterium]
MIRTHLAAWAAAFALLATPAAAQKVKKDGSDELATGEAAAKGVVRPDEAKDAPPPADAELESFVADKEKQLSQVRQRQIVDMRQILKKDPLYKRKADLLFRIAEKEWAEGKYRYFLERKEYDKQYEEYLKGTLKKSPEEPSPDYSKALVEYKALLKEFPNYKRIDEVMFYLGQGLITAGKKKEGASYMLRLTKDYPKSKYVTRAYLAVAEYYFDNDLLFAAKTNYQKVIEDENSQQYPYALYKLGYVHYNLKEYEESITSFQKVVALSKGQDRRKVYFTNQAYSALSLAYAEVEDGWKRARDYFRQVGGAELATKQLEKIARTYSSQDKMDLEIAVYEYLIGENKQGGKIPEYAEYVTAAWKKMEDLGKTDEVINRFITYFDPKGSWHTVNKDNEEAMTRSKQYREEQMDWLIGTYHTKAQEFEEKLKDEQRASEHYAKAATYYRKYLEMFPDGKDNYDKEFYLAEILAYQAQDWDEAMQRYANVVKRDPKGKYSKDSAYKVILVAEEKMGKAGVIDPPEHFKDNKVTGKAAKPTVVYTERKNDKEFKPIPETELHATEQGFVDACKMYTDTYPKDDEVPAVSFRAAEVYIKKGHYPEGIKRLEVIMEHHPKHQFASFAAATLFDSNYRLRRWDQMERWARYMLTKKNYKVLKKKQLQDVIAVSINNYATELKEKGAEAAKGGDAKTGNDFKEQAVKQWLRFVDEFGRKKELQEKAAIALFNAAATTEELENTEKAIDLYESVIKRYPKSSQATESHFVLGALYESQTDFKTAANYFEKMASFPDVPQMADALYNAGAIRAALEEYEQAIDIFETYVKKFPERDDVREIYIKIAEFYEKLGKFGPAHKAYDNYIKKYRGSRADSLVEIHLRKAKLYIAEGGKNGRRSASKELGEAAKVFKKLPEEIKAGTDANAKQVRRAAAEARFLEGEFIYQDFEEVKVSFPDRVLRRTLVQKANLLEKANKVYFEVLDFKAHDVSAGALFRIGESFYLFAKSLFDLPVPEELSEDEKFIYRAELDDRAAPLQEKAIEALQRAVQLAHKNHVYNVWSRQSAATLVKLSPESFPVLNDSTNDSTWRVPATFSTNFIKDPQGKLELLVTEPPKPATTPAPGAGAPGAEKGAEGVAPEAAPAAATEAAAEGAAKKGAK